MASSGKRISGAMMAASVGILGSRVSGLARDMVFAYFWGTSSALGAFFIAFTIPNLVRRLLGEGALSEGFVPLFNERLVKAGKENAFGVLNNVLTVVSLVLMGLVVIGMVACLAVAAFMEPGMGRLAMRLAAWLLPYTFFICLVGFLTGVLNSFGRFSLPFLAPVILNGLFIAATLWLCPWLSDDPRVQVIGLVIAVIVSGVVQLAGMWWLLRGLGFRWHWRPDFRSEGIRELVVLVLPAVLGAAVYQVNVLCDRLVAGWLGGYAVTSLYYSERLIYLPIGIFAVALSAACLPVMSRAMAEGQHEAMLSALLYSLRHIFFLTLPCVLIFMLQGREILALVFGRGNFDAASLEATLAALLFYAPGIPAFAAVKIVRAGFFSRKDTRTPVRIAVVCMVLNVILNVALMFHLQQRGIALATAISTWLNVVILLVLLLRSIKPALGETAQFWGSLAKQGVALLVAAAVILLVRHPETVATTMSLTTKLLAFAIPLGAASLAWLAVHLLLRSRELAELGGVLFGRLRKRRGHDRL